jgi:nucleoside-diphosphate-sugar epimerase
MEVNYIPKNIVLYYTGNSVCDNLKLNISNFKKCNENFNVTLITNDAFILDLAKNTFHSLHLNPSISFVDTPEDIRDKYQYFTEADMTKLISTGYTIPFHTLENGVKDYVENYLSGHFYY